MLPMRGRDLPTATYNKKKTFLRQTLNFAHNSEKYIFLNTFKFEFRHSAKLNSGRGEREAEIAGSITQKMCCRLRKGKGRGKKREKEENPAESPSM